MGRVAPSASDPSPSLVPGTCQARARHQGKILRVRHQGKILARPAALEAPLRAAALSPPVRAVGVGARTCLAPRKSPGTKEKSAMGRAACSAWPSTVRATMNSICLFVEPAVVADAFADDRLEVEQGLDLRIGMRLARTLRRPCREREPEQVLRCKSYFNRNGAIAGFGATAPAARSPRAARAGRAACGSAFGSVGEAARGSAGRPLPRSASVSPGAMREAVREAGGRRSGRLLNVLAS